MKLKKWNHIKVDKKGRVPGGGQIDVILLVKNSVENGCNVPCCKCTNAHWISINLGRQKNGSVHGITYFFKTREELLQYVTSN